MFVSLKFGVMERESSRVEGKRCLGRGMVSWYPSPYLDVLKIKREIDIFALDLNVLKIKRGINKNDKISYKLIIILLLFYYIPNYFNDFLVDM